MALTAKEIYDLNNMNVAAQNVGLGTLLDEVETFDSSLLSATAGVATASKAAILGTTKNLDTLVIADGGLKLGAGAGTAVTATAAEINLIDGSVAGTAVASKALSLGADKNVDVLVVADGGLSLGAGAGTAVTSTAAELNLNDGSLPGTVVASKTAVYDAGGKLYRSSASPAGAGVDVTDATALTAELNYVTGANGTVGVVLPVAAANETVTVINSVTTAGNYLNVYAITGSQINALGSTVAFQLNPGQTATFIGRSSTLWNTASASDTISGLTATAAELNYNDIATLGTGAASKSVVLDTGEDYTWPATGVLTYGVLKDPAATTLAATALEMNRTCDVSTRLVAATGTLSVTVAEHDGKTILLDTAGGSVCTLPVAAATGARIRFAVTVRPSGASHVIKVGNASDFIAGQIHMIDLDSNAVTGYQGDGSADDTITINNTTTGGAVGDYIEVEDTLANVWTVVHGNLTVPTGSNVADPFSATV